MTTTYFRRGAEVVNGDSDSCEILYTIPITVNVEASITPTISSSTGAFTFCVGDSPTFESQTIPAGLVTYTWSYFNGTSTVTSTGTGTTTEVTIVANGYIQLDILTAAGCEYTTRESITLADAINTALTAPTTICPSESVTISVATTSQATYTFYVGGTQQQESSSATFTTTGISRTSSVVITITNASGCSETVSTVINVVDLEDGGSITPTNSTICMGGDSPSISNLVSATLEDYSSAASITYFWEQSFDTVSWTTVAGTESSLAAAAVTGIVTTTYFRRGAEVVNGDSDSCEILYSSNATVAVQDIGAVSIISSTGSFTFCEGDIIDFTASPVGQATYTWTYDNGVSVNSSSSAGTTTRVVIVGNGAITLDVTTAAGCVYSFTQSYTVSSKIEPVLTAFQTICSGSSLDVSASLADPAVGAYTYTFIRAGVAIPSATDTSTSSYAMTGLSDGEVIAVRVTDSGTGCSGTSSFTINVINALSSVGSITRSDSDTLCAGDTPTTIFGDGTSGSASATTTTGTIIYQWYYKTATMADFIVTGNNPLVDQSNNYSPPALLETTTYKRLASVLLNGVACSESFSLTEEIVVFDGEGGSLDSVSTSVCFSFGAAAPTITVSGSSVGDYQWQDSSDGIVFANITGALQVDYTPTITATGTFYFRRVTTVGTCSDTTDIYTLTVDETNAGSLDTSPSGVYCYGSQPPELGIGTSDNGSSGLNAITYRWESKIDGALGGYVTIAGETNRSYQPPPLFANPTNETTVYLYRRVSINPGGCESVASNVVSITITPEILTGYLEFQNVDPDNYYICEGQDVENLVLGGLATPVSAGVVTYTWQQSEDLLTWTEVPSSSSNASLNFGTSNTPTQTTHYRVKISSSSGSPSSTTSVVTIFLDETGEAITTGEIYTVSIDGEQTFITTSAAVSTTDTIGAALALSITNSISGYTATYFADQDIILVNSYSDEVTLSRSSSSTLFIKPVLLSYSAVDDFCSAYTNVVTVNIYEPPSINQTGGSIDGQTICLDSAIDPITFEVTGSYDFVEIKGIDDVFEVTAGGTGSATYSALTGWWTVSNTSVFTITGTPTLLADQSLFISIETSGSCDTEATYNYRIETVDTPNTPDIIYRNDPRNSESGYLANRYQIFQNDGSWYNNTVCQDTDDVLPDNDALVYEFAACYSNNQDLRYVKFDWEILPPTAVSSITFKNTDDANMQAILTVGYDSSTVTFTSGFDYTITITSPDGTETTVTFTTVEDDITENLDDLDNDLEGLPSISSSRSGNILTLTADTSGEDGYFSIQVLNPDAAEIFINSPEYLYPEQDNAIEVVFNPDFGTTTPTSDGVTATLRVRAESIECDDEFSDWYEVELYFLSEQNPVADFPNIREPEALTRTYCAGNTNGTVPTCEIDANTTLRTTFYSAAEAGEENNYAYLEYKIDNIAAGDATAPFPGRYYQEYGGIHPVYGTISWLPGFHGQFDLCVRAVACDGTEDTWDCYTYVISPESAMPDVTAVNIPVCPIDSNTVTTTFSSNLMVNWTINPSTSFSSTSTRSVSGLDVFDVVWEEGYAGMVWITADVKDCAGDPRYYTVRIPENPVFTRTSTTTVQTICQAETISPIIYDISGYSVLGINDAELPDGLTGVYSPTAQEATIRVFRRFNSVDDSDNKYIIAIDYSDYEYEADGTESLTEITESITTMITSSTLVGTATSTTSNNSSTITIVGATPGVRFNIASNTPETSRFTISQPTINNLNGTYTITGSISETLSTTSNSYEGIGPSGVSQIHHFDLTVISSNASCTTVTQTVVFNYSPNDIITTVTPTLLTQYICDGDDLEEIEFQLSGGATDYDAPVWYPSQPVGLEFSPEAGDVLGATTSFSLSGTLNTGVTTTTVYYYTLTSNGSTCDTDTVSGSVIVYPKEEIKTTPVAGQVYCQSEEVNFDFEFEGISSLAISTASSATLSTLGLSTSIAYTSTPSVELTVVASATSVGEYFQIEIINESGVIYAHQYQSTTGSESTTTIATALKNSIDANAFVSASLTSSNVISIVADSKSYVFWVRINESNTGGSVEHNDNVRMRVTDAEAVAGTFSITGTPTVDITETTTYSLIITTPGVLCSAATQTFEFSLLADQSISITSSASTQIQYVCDGEAIDDVTFFLEGNSNGYSIEWSSGVPNGIAFTPLSNALFGTSTITLSGTLNTGATTTTVYHYSITTSNTTIPTCESQTVTGSLVIYPKEEILLSPPAVQTYELTDYIDLEFTFQGVSDLTLTASSSADFSALGLTQTTSYTAVPSVELTVVASGTTVGEYYQIEIVELSGAVRSRYYQTTTATASISTIALGLANAINLDGSVSASLTSSNVISIVADDLDYVFWIRINEGFNAGTIEHGSNARMNITSAVPVQGVFSLTGTPTAVISATTSYTFNVLTPGVQCDTDSATTTVFVIPGAQITLVSSATTLNQELVDEDSIENVEFTLGGTANDYSVEWPNGIPSNLSISPDEGALFGTSTLTLSGSLETGATTTTIYYYTITPLDGVDEGSPISGSFVVFPKEEISLSPGAGVTYCSTDYIDLTYQFEGYGSLSVSSTTSSTISTLGIFSDLTYTTTPSVELTIVASGTSINEIFQIEIVEEDGGSRALFYQTTTATASISSITTELAAAIDLDPSVSASLTASNVINVSAINSDYVFWIRVNEGATQGSMETYDAARIRVTDAIPVTGEFTLTGTPTVSISETTTYSLIVSSPGIRSDATSATTLITLNPEQIITLTSSTTSLNQEVCDNSAIEEVVFQLDGSATGYGGLNWIGATPGGISEPTLSASNTLTLTGTITTGVTTTTVYNYSITTTGPSCESNTVTGSITVLPNHYIAFSAASQSDQTICDQGDLETIDFELSGGATGYTVTWSPSNPGLSVYRSAANSTTFTISGTINTSVTSETVYTYTITTLGNSCDVSTAFVTGEITVVPQLVINVDTPLTQNQIGSNALCNGDDIQAITFSFTSGNSPTIDYEWTDADGLLLLLQDQQ